MTWINCSLTPFERSRPISLAWLIAGIYISIIINVVFLVWQTSILLPNEPSYTFIGIDTPRELPIKVRNVNMVFHDDQEHYALTGTQAWAEWNEIRPPGKGYIFLGDEYYPFGVSMWHQIHCLNHIRTMFVNGDDGSDHTEHCFHYLRQALLCAADTTLEYGGPAMRSPTGDVVATGANVTHTCRDWKQVHDYLEDEHRKWSPEMASRMKEVSDGTNKGADRHMGHKEH